MGKQDIQEKIDLIELFHDRLGVGEKALELLYKEKDKLEKQERTVNGVLFDSVEEANEEKRHYVGTTRYGTVEEAEEARREQIRKEELHRKECAERERTKHKKISEGKRIANWSLLCAVIAWMGTPFLRVLAVFGVVGTVLGIISRRYHKTIRSWYGIIIGPMIIYALVTGIYDEAEKTVSVDQEQEKDYQNLRGFSTADGSVTIKLNRDWKIEDLGSDFWLGVVSADNSEGTIIMQFPKNSYIEVADSMDSVKFFVEDRYSIMDSEEMDIPTIPGVINIESYLFTVDVEGEKEEAYIVYGETDYAYYSFLYMADKIDKTRIALINESYATFIETPIDDSDYSFQSENKEGDSSIQSQGQEEILAENMGEFILPESGDRYLTIEDLEGLDKETLRLARNEIYAKHGRKYETEDLNEYFSSKSWYHGYLSAEEFDDSVFNEYEKANLDLIKSVEGIESSLNVNWEGTYIGEDDQTIIISATDDSGVVLTFVGYSEEGWKTNTEVLSYKDEEKTQVSQPYYYDGVLVQEVVYSITETGIQVETLPSGGWADGLYLRQ